MFRGALILVAAGILSLGAIAPAFAQDPAPNPQAPAPTAAQTSAPPVATSDKNDSTASKPAPKPKKVWTNEDLAALRADSPVSVVGSQKTNARPNYYSPQDQSELMARMYRLQIDQVQSQIDAVDKQISSIRDSLSGKGSDATRNYDPWGGKPGDLNSQLDQLQKRRDTLVQQQDQLEEQLRRLNF
jgi:hypothetical protein